MKTSRRQMRRVQEGKTRHMIVTAKEASRLLDIPARKIRDAGAVKGNECRLSRRGKTHLYSLAGLMTVL